MSLCACICWGDRSGVRLWSGSNWFSQNSLWWLMVFEFTAVRVCMCVCYKKIRRWVGSYFEPEQKNRTRSDMMQWTQVEYFWKHFWNIYVGDVFCFFLQSKLRRNINKRFHTSYKMGSLFPAPDGGTQWWFCCSNVLMTDDRFWPDSHSRAHSHRGDLPLPRGSLVVPWWSPAGVRHHQRQLGSQDGAAHVHRNALPHGEGVSLP